MITSVWARTAGILLAVLLAGTAAQAQNAVSDWNTIASTTIVTNAGKSPAASTIWFAYSSIAVYDAVNAIHGGFQPFFYNGTGAPGASEEAAAIAAAHRVLVTYFKNQQTALDAQFTASLNQLSVSSDAKVAGVVVSEAAAAALIAARAGDGLEANGTYTPGSGPGVWQPTPPKFGPAATPWLAQMRPFTMTSNSQFLPDGPTSLSSEEWIDDYNLTRALGEVDSIVRTPTQTEIGLFWTDHPGWQYAGAFNNLASSHNLNSMESARMMAILWTGAADALIGCWNAKFTYNFWRPITAIRVGGGNPNLVTDADWTPLGTTPSHPDYPSAHACFTGAVSSLIRGYFRTRKVQIVVNSRVFSDGVHMHTFDDTRDLFEEVFWARIYTGFHYHHSMEDVAPWEEESANSSSVRLRTKMVRETLRVTRAINRRGHRYSSSGCHSLS
jgi:PAP2 superfamily